MSDYKEVFADDRDPDIVVLWGLFFTSSRSCSNSKFVRSIPSSVGSKDGSFFISNENHAPVDVVVAVVDVVVDLAVVNAAVVVVHVVVAVDMLL